jgi:UDP-N-acetylmuramyl pentapeptide phosphotransferase/UDP-N-acetylglucosamine-1-phosphate transferase
MLITFIIFLLNLRGMALYLRYAKKKAILDLPNLRSSHDHPTIRGGGLFLAPSFFALILIYSQEYFFSGIAILLGAAISYIDDLKNLSARIRLPFQLLAVMLLLMSIQSSWSLWTLVLGLILITGWINTFNFMDGINGISAIYAIVYLASVALTITQAQTIHFSLYIITGMLSAVLAFLYYNFREKALCFMGDVGSVGLALILAWFFLVLWNGGNSLFLFLFVLLYAVDSVMTILLRLIRGENIFQAHRSHLYQILANEKSIDHRSIAAYYGFLQFVINLLAIYWISDLNVQHQLIYIIVIYLTFCALYFILRFKFLE